MGLSPIFADLFCFRESEYKIHIFSDFIFQDLRICSLKIDEILMDSRNKFGIQFDYVNSR